jgi:hypothetical protein
MGPYSYHSVETMSMNHTNKDFDGAVVFDGEYWRELDLVEMGEAATGKND